MRRTSCSPSSSSCREWLAARRRWRRQWAGCLWRPSQRPSRSPLQPPHAHLPPSPPSSIIFCTFAKRFLQGIPALEVRDFSWDTLRKVLLPGSLFVLNIVVGWYGLQLVNIPLFLCIRRTTTAFTLLAEYLILGRKQSSAVITSVLLIVLGSIVAGWENLSSDYMGVSYTMLNNILTAVSVSVVKRFSDKTGTTGFTLVYYNALVALPLCLAGATLFGEWQYTLDYPRVMETVRAGARVCARDLSAAR